MKRKRGRPKKHQPGVMRRTKPGTKKQTQAMTALAEMQDMRELLFAQEYLTDLDPVGAALRTGLISMRLETKEQEKQALLIFNRPAVQKHVRKLIGDRMVRIGITEDGLLRQLNNIACFDPADLNDENGDVRAMQDISPDIRRCIQEFTYQVKYKTVSGERVPVGHVSKIKLYNKLDALKTLLGHFKGEVTGDKPSINYNQFNIGAQINSNNNNNNKSIASNVDMSDFTDLELQVIRKIAGEHDPHDFIELQQLERQFYET